MEMRHKEIKEKREKRKKEQKEKELLQKKEVLNKDLADIDRRLLVEGDANIEELRKKRKGIEDDCRKCAEEVEQMREQVKKQAEEFKALDRARREQEQQA